MFHVNFLAHAHVALASDRDDPRYVLGAVLPDLASMAGVRFQRERLDGQVAEGVRCHYAADREFHAHPGFRRGSAAIRGDLAARGVRSGAARAIGHVGWELLADSTLVRSPTEDAYWDALGYGEMVTAGIDEPVHRARWATFLSHRHRRPVLSYDDPTWVAERVFAMLERRPRLGFPHAQLPVVTAVLETHFHRVTSAVGGVLAEVTAAHERHLAYSAD